MQERIEARREQLAAELEQGQTMLAELEARRAELQQTLLRISGALQVLGELLDEGEPTAGSGGPTAGPSAGPVAATSAA